MVKWASYPNSLFQHADFIKFCLFLKTLETKFIKPAETSNFEVIARAERY